MDLSEGWEDIPPHKILKNAQSWIYLGLFGREGEKTGERGSEQGVGGELKVPPHAQEHEACDPFILTNLASIPYERPPVI